MEKVTQHKRSLFEKMALAKEATTLYKTEYEEIKKRKEAKEEMLPQGTEMEDVTSNPQPHLNTARTPTPNTTGTCQELLSPTITWQGLRPQD